MYILSIESSCDETAVAVLHAENHTLTAMSDCIASQVDTHRLYGGVVPEIASRAHVEAISSLTESALAEADLTLDKIDLVAVTSHPGLIGALLVGVNFGKSLAVSHGIPLVGVDHIKGHIAAAYVTREGDAPMPKPPFLALVLSGGHTSFFLCEDYHTHRLIGQTRDDAMGEAFDKVGRLLDLPYPAGAAMDRLASEGYAALGCDVLSYKHTEAARDALYKLPAPDLLPEQTDSGSYAYDFSFSGPKTAAVNLMHRLSQKGEAVDRARFAAHVTSVMAEGVARQTERVLGAYGNLPLVLAGGVAANTHLRLRLAQLCKQKGTSLILPPRALCGDNGTMIAAAGYYAYLAGERADSALGASASDTID